MSATVDSFPALTDSCAAASQILALFSRCIDVTPEPERNSQLLTMELATLYTRLTRLRLAVYSPDDANLSAIITPDVNRLVDECYSILLQIGSVETTQVQRGTIGTPALQPLDLTLHLTPERLGRLHARLSTCNELLSVFSDSLMPE